VRSVTLLRLRGLRNSSAILAKLKKLIDIDTDVGGPNYFTRYVEPTMPDEQVHETTKTHIHCTVVQFKTKVSAVDRN